jgi:hypothetical protein
VWGYDLKCGVHLINTRKIHFPRNCEHYVHYKECLWEIVTVDYVSCKQHGIELLASSLGFCIEDAQFSPRITEQDLKF